VTPHVLASIRTELLSNTSLERYRYVNLLSKALLFHTRYDLGISLETLKEEMSDDCHTLCSMSPDISKEKIFFTGRGHKGAERIRLKDG
jgi:hypothetical protein